MLLLIGVNEGQVSLFQRQSRCVVTSGWGKGATPSQRNLNESELKEEAQKTKNKHEAGSQQFGSFCTVKKVSVLE